MSYRTLAKNKATPAKASNKCPALAAHVRRVADQPLHQSGPAQGISFDVRRRPAKRESHLHAVDAHAVAAMPKTSQEPATYAKREG